MAGSAADPAPPHEAPSISDLLKQSDWDARLAEARARRQEVLAQKRADADTQVPTTGAQGAARAANRISMQMSGPAPITPLGPAEAAPAPTMAIAPPGGGALSERLQQLLQAAPVDPDRPSARRLTPDHPQQRRAEAQALPLTALLGARQTLASAARAEQPPTPVQRAQRSQPRRRLSASGYLMATVAGLAGGLILAVGISGSQGTDPVARGRQSAPVAATPPPSPPTVNLALTNTPPVVTGPYNAAANGIATAPRGAPDLSTPDLSIPGPSTPRRAAGADLPRPNIAPVFTADGRPLLGPVDPARVRLRLMSGAETGQDAGQALDRLQEAGFSPATTPPVRFAPTHSIVRVYHATDLAAAHAVALLTGAHVMPLLDFQPRPPLGSLDLWLAGPA